MSHHDLVLFGRRDAAVVKVVPASVHFVLAVGRVCRGQRAEASVCFSKPLYARNSTPNPFEGWASDLKGWMNIVTVPLDRWSTVR